MNIQRLKKGCALTLACYVVIMAAFYWICGDQLRFRDEQTDPVTAAAPIGELIQGQEVRQPFIAKADEIQTISLLLSTYARENTCAVWVQIADKSGSPIGQAELSAASIEDNAVHKVVFQEPVRVVPGERYDIVLSSPDGAPGNAITAWHGNTMSAARVEVPLTILREEQLRVNGEGIDSLLVYSMQMRNNLLFGQVYWYLVLIIGAVLAGYCVYLIRSAEKNRSTVVLRLISAFDRYGYLMKQLISRDFKTKYKRSVLGVLWSFLNPLMTMTVQYIVFSTLFKSDIPNFPLYLLSGIVCFNFFNESSGMALMSIIGNASLITKVYVPKYIYPLSRVLSSGINLLLSLIPLFAVMLLMGTPVRPALLLLPFGLICLMAFSIGVGFVLSTAMVFFRDTQFLWGVVSMLWMYATPIFYPESIIGTQFLPLFKCNPLYHIIRFIRIILIDGVSPEPKAYALCLMVSFVPLLIGAIIFKKNQDKFILNL